MCCGVVSSSEPTYHLAGSTTVVGARQTTSPRVALALATLSALGSFAVSFIIMVAHPPRLDDPAELLEVGSEPDQVAVLAALILQACTTAGKRCSAALGISRAVATACHRGRALASDWRCGHRQIDAVAFEPDHPICSQLCMQSGGDLELTGDTTMMLHCLHLPALLHRLLPEWQARLDATVSHGGGAAAAACCIRLQANDGQAAALRCCAGGRLSVDPTDPGLGPGASPTVPTRQSSRARHLMRAHRRCCC